MPQTVSAKIEDFFAAYRTRTYPKGQILMLNGEDTGSVYHLLEGQVKVYDVTYRGDEVILNIFKPPAFFPMSIAINQTANPYVYEAETDVVIRQAPAEAAVMFIKDNPDVMYDLLKRLYSGVDGLLQRMSLLMGGSAKSRLLYELILEARRFGESSDDGTSLLAVSEKTLGARAGLSRETVSREVQKLKRDDLIEVRANGILVKDMQALEVKLGQSV